MIDSFPLVKVDYADYQILTLVPHPAFAKKSLKIGPPVRTRPKLREICVFRCDGTGMLPKIAEESLSQFSRIPSIRYHG
jgi:hypothetical protein